MRDELVRRTAEHAAIVGISVGIALVVGLVLGVVAARHRAFALVSLTLAAAVLNVPSLALFGFLAVWLGFFNPLVPVVGLAIYAVLPVLRNTYAGIRSVEPAAVEAATGMGMTRRQMLWRVQLPLATPVIMAGLRQSAVMTVGIGTVAAAVDPLGLGVLIFHALGSYAPEQIVVAALPAALLGILTDRALAGAERAVGRSRLGGGGPTSPVGPTSSTSMQGAPV
ncbi:MAG TPA: ABC transporter permease [Actinomycetota bacterium]|jgi:osmoprotectant transport system permease protein